MYRVIVKKWLAELYHVALNVRLADEANLMLNLFHTSCSKFPIDRVWTPFVKLIKFPDSRDSKGQVHLVWYLAHPMKAVVWYLGHRMNF